MKVIAGLGNPGRKYQETRHNAGFLAVDTIAPSGETFTTDKRNEVLKTRIANEVVMLVKPQSYMNLSGEALQNLLHYYKVPVQDLIVLVDDVNLECGRIRIRNQGSHGGQNGLRNIIQHLGPNFVRIRLGVGPVPVGWDLADFVLSKWGKKDRQVFQEALDKVPGMVDTLLKKGLAEAMNQYNGK